MIDTILATYIIWFMLSVVFQAVFILEEGANWIYRSPCTDIRRLSYYFKRSDLRIIPSIIVHFVGFVFYMLVKFLIIAPMLPFILIKYILVDWKFGVILHKIFFKSERIEL
jgi:hypothetical protein